MQVKRWVAAAATTVLVAGIGVAGASPASAQDLGAFNGCIEGGVSWTVDDSFTLVWDDEECLRGTVSMSGSSWSEAVVDGDTCWTFTFVEAPGAVSTTDYSAPYGVLIQTLGVSTTTAVATVCGDPVERVIAGVPTVVPAWVQAYGRDGADAACEDGWDASWQTWAETVTGGWVCTRSISSLG